MPDIHALQEDSLRLELTAGVHDFNGEYFTLEVTVMEDGAALDHDTAHSHLPVNAYPDEIAAYLKEAMAWVKHEAGPGLAITGVATAGAAAGQSGVRAHALGFDSVDDMIRHQLWLEGNRLQARLASDATLAHSVVQAKTGALLNMMDAWWPFLHGQQLDAGTPRQHFDEASDAIDARLSLPPLISGPVDTPEGLRNLRQKIGDFLETVTAVIHQKNQAIETMLKVWWPFVEKSVGRIHHSRQFADDALALTFTPQAATTRELLHAIINETGRQPGTDATGTLGRIANLAGEALGTLGLPPAAPAKPHKPSTGLGM